MHMTYKGIIIEESLQNTDVLKDLIITHTEVEPVTESHKTPWLTQWTMHTVEIPEEDIDTVIEKLSSSIDTEHNAWYADFKNNVFHYIVFRNRVFKVDMKNPIQYKDAKAYGISLGIPEYQVDFAPEEQTWKRE